MSLAKIKKAIMDLSNSELYELQEVLNLEIELSEKAIEFGTEERK